MNSLNQLPVEIVNQIYEYASDHREKFSKCISQIIRRKAAKVYMHNLLLHYGWEAWSFHEIVRLLTTKHEFDKYFREEYEYIQSQKIYNNDKIIP